jgi:hypothetical protein
MSGLIFLAIVAAIALSAPAWADDPAGAPIDTERRAILLDPAEAPIDTEMKIILWLEAIEAPLREHTPIIEVSTELAAADPCSAIRASLPLIAGGSSSDQSVRIAAGEARSISADGGKTVRSGLEGRAIGGTGPTIAEYRSAPTNTNIAAE